VQDEGSSITSDRVLQAESSEGSITVVISFHSGAPHDGFQKVLGNRRGRESLWLELVGGGDTLLLKKTMTSTIPFCEDNLIEEGYFHVVWSFQTSFHDELVECLCFGQHFQVCTGILIRRTKKSRHFKIE
jgi:hypothetical protein